MKRFGMLLAAAIGLLFATSSYAADKKIERLWKAKCASCHGADGTAQTEKGKKMKVGDMTLAAFQKKTDEELTKVTLEGYNKEEGGVKKEMDGYKAELKPGEMEGLLVLMREFAKK